MVIQGVRFNVTFLSMGLASTFIDQISSNMAHLNAKTYGFVNLQEKLQKNSFKVQNLRQKFLMFFSKLTDSAAVKIKTNVQNCALSKTEAISSICSK